MQSENDGEPNLTGYYPVSNDVGLNDLSEITLKQISMAFFLLGLIAFMINGLMVYLFMRQEWAVIWPRTSAAQFGVVFMGFGGILYLFHILWERKFR